MAHNLPALSDSLVQLGYPKPSQQWLQSLVSARVLPPLPALIATAKIKLSKLDLLIPGLFSADSPPSSYLPPNVAQPDKKEVVLKGPVVLQVLEVYDIGKSKWEQIEAIESIERGEKTKGREIIRDIPNPEDEGGEDAFAASVAQSKNAGPHKLVLQDWKGTQMYGMEVEGVQKVGITMAIGSKIVVSNLSVCRGVAMLDGNNATVLGGEIKELNEKWVKERKKMLQDGMPKKDGD